MATPDFVDEVTEERTRANPQFPALVDAALERRLFLRDLAAWRERLGLSQTAVAGRMGTSQSAVARLEAGEADVRLSTVERYAAALGVRVVWQVVGADGPAGTGGDRASPVVPRPGRGLAGRSSRERPASSRRSDGL